MDRRKRPAWVKLLSLVSGALLLCLACNDYYDPNLVRRRTTFDSPFGDGAVMDAAPAPPDAPVDEAGPAPDAGLDDAGPAQDDAAVDAADPDDAQADAEPDPDDDAGVDDCPDDPGKTAPGVCGCGIPDTDGASVASCVGLRDALVHRYRFEGAGTAVTDAVGPAHGMLIGTTLADNGTLTLAGGTSDQHVDLPNGLISGLQDVTIEVWVSWAGGDPWQRIFDFGDSTDTVEGVQATGRTHLFITPLASGSAGTNLLALFKTPAGDFIAEAAAPLPMNVVKHIAVVIDDAADLMTLYLDGELAASITLTATLSEINDINSWIGRSQWLADPEFGGVLHELRIYDAPLAAPQLATSFSAGPDPAFLDP